MSKNQIKDSVIIPNYDKIIQFNQRLWNEFGEETPDLSLQSNISYFLTSFSGLYFTIT